MLFVFGRRAQQLRHKKLSDLIHHSATLPNLQFTRVEVHFQYVVDAPAIELVGIQTINWIAVMRSRETIYSFRNTSRAIVTVME